MMGKPGYVSMNLIKGFVAPALPKDCDVRVVGSDDDHALLRLPARRLASGVACCGTAMFKQITVYWGLYLAFLVSHASIINPVILSTIHSKP